MYTEQLIATQRDWAERGLMSARRLLPLMTPVSTHPDWNAEDRRAVGYLASATARASESALLLCAYGQLWDAEVVTRSALEGSLKFAYLLQASGSFDDRHREYAEALFAIALLKDHLKAQGLLATARDPGDAEWRPIRDRLLSDRDVQDVRERFNRVRRRELETRWGFTGLVSELSGSGDILFRDIGATAHAYSMASHIHHADMVGASIPLDRDRRSAARREQIHLAHEVRLICDILAFLYLRLAVGYRFIGADTAPLAEAEAAVKTAREWRDEAYRAWMDA